MNISFSQPLALGWRRMKMLLFQPLDPGRWFVLGFTAWLAQLSGGIDGGSGTSTYRLQNHSDFESLTELGDASWHWFTGSVDHAFGALLVVFLMVGALLLAILALWISSRGQFMILDNLVRSRAAVKRPWQAYAQEANSLFLWSLGFSVVAVIVGTVVVTGFVALTMSGSLLPDWVRLLLSIGLGGAGFLLVVTGLYIEYFLKFFVVPIMYRHHIGASAAWGRFLAIFRRDPAAFALCGLFYLLIFVSFTAIYIMGGILTCCLGLALLAIPYLGTVLMLPVTVLGRYLNLEFLAQFGADSTLLPPLSEGPGTHSGQFDTDGTVIRPEDLGVDGGRDQPRPQDR